MRTLALLLIIATGCAPPPEIRCLGPRPFTCESDCVVFCQSSIEDDAGVFYVSRDQVCTPSCWNRPDGGAP